MWKKERCKRSLYKGFCNFEGKVQSYKSIFREILRKKLYFLSLSSCSLGSAQLPCRLSPSKALSLSLSSAFSRWSLCLQHRFFSFDPLSPPLTCPSLKDKQETLGKCRPPHSIHSGLLFRLQHLLRRHFFLLNKPGCSADPLSPPSIAIFRRRRKRDKKEKQTNWRNVFF